MHDKTFWCSIVREKCLRHLLYVHSGYDTRDPKDCVDRDGAIQWVSKHFSLLSSVCPEQVNVCNVRLLFVASAQKRILKLKISRNSFPLQHWLSFYYIVFYLFLHLFTFSFSRSLQLAEGGLSLSNFTHVTRVSVVESKKQTVSIAHWARTYCSRNTQGCNEVLWWKREMLAERGGIANKLPISALSEHEWNEWNTI